MQTTTSNFIKRETIMGTRNVLLNALVITVIGSYGCTLQEQESSKRFTGENSSDLGSSKNEKKDGVSFSFGLPKDFEESEDEQVEADDSNMVEEFKGIGQNKYLNVTCEDDSAIDLDYFSGKKLRAILEISLEQIVTIDEPMKEDSSYEKDSKDLGSKLIDKEDSGKDEKTFKCKNERCLQGEESEVDFIDENSDELFEENPYAMETILVPFVCKSGATIQISNLEGDSTYAVAASLYSSHGSLKYSGYTGEFGASSGKIQLNMEQVEKSEEVSIEVVFENKKKAQKD
jgi:hypothetical protein